MLQQLFNLIQENGNEAVINNPAVPNEQNNAVLGDATHAVADGLQHEMAGGGLQNILSLFKNNSSSGGLLSNPIVSNIISSFTNKLTSSQHLPAAEAGNIANGLIPTVMNKLINITNDTNDTSFTLSNIINSLSGSGNAQNGNGFDLGNLLNSFTGNNTENNGSKASGLSELISKVTEGAQQQQQNKAGGGGLMDMIKKLI